MNLARVAIACVAIAVPFVGAVLHAAAPQERKDVPKAVSFMFDRTSGKFISDAKLRPAAEIVEQADRIYRYLWAVFDAWLIRYMDADWDDVSTDT